MATDLTVNNTTFAYPSAGDEPGWGEDATGWAGEVTTVLASVVPAGSIAEATATILDNTASPADVTSLIFSSSQIRSTTIAYVIVRGALEESGQLKLVFNGSSWDMTREFMGDFSGVDLTVAASGQVQYTSSNTGTSGTIKFKTVSVLSA